MVFLPLAFVFVVINFPVGLVLYWMTTNLWTVGQGLVTRRAAEAAAARGLCAETLVAHTARTRPGAGRGRAEEELTQVPAPAVAASPQPPRRVKRKKKKTRR